MLILKRLPFAFLLVGLAVCRAGYAAPNDVPGLGATGYSDLCVS